MHKVVSSILAVSALLAAIVLPVSAGHVVTNEQEINDTPSQANPVRLQTGVIGSTKPGDVDFFGLRTDERMARYEVRVQIYTPHPPLSCDVTVAVRGENGGPNQIIYSQDIDYRVSWLARTSLYYVSIESSCENMHYQLDFSQTSSAYRVYLPTATMPQGFPLRGGAAPIKERAGG